MNKAETISVFVFLTICTFALITKWLSIYHAIFVLLFTILGIAYLHFVRKVKLFK
jgi:hypothetical protein